MRGLLFLALVALPLTARAVDTSTPAAPAVDPYQDGLKKLQSKDPMVQRQGIEQLAQARRPEAAPAILPLLNSPEAHVRAAAANALGLLHATQAVKPLSDLLEKDKDPGARQAAATALAYLGDPAAVPALISALDDKDAGVRYGALRTLGAMRASAAIPALSKLLKDDDIALRRGAAAALAQFRTPAAAAALKPAISDPDAEVRMNAVGALAASPDASAAPALLEALKDGDTSVRLKAAQGLATIGISSGVPVALAALSDPQPATRQRAAATLGLIGDAKTGLPALDKAFKSEQDQVTRGVIDFARAQLKSRLGIVDKTKATAPEVGVSTAPLSGKPKIKPKAKAKAKPKAKTAPAKKTP